MQQSRKQEAMRSYRQICKLIDGISSINDLLRGTIMLEGWQDILDRVVTCQCLRPIFRNPKACILYTCAYFNSIQYHKHFYRKQPAAAMTLTDVMSHSLAIVNVPDHINSSAQQRMNMMNISGILITPKKGADFILSSAESLYEKDRFIILCLLSKSKLANQNS